ncbi:hypothetical protein ACFQNE_14140 [Gordonia phosphorivorans]|uniref:Uncharacterized protein n=1 Tax=Gordonia phosphorivorans TaxID=1056982 RepID=A0ABV6H8G2_9ACTN
MKIILTDQFRKAVEHSEEVCDPPSKPFTGDARGLLFYDDHDTLRLLFDDPSYLWPNPPESIASGPALVIEDRPDIAVEVIVSMHHDSDARAVGFLLEAVLQIDDAQGTHRAAVGGCMDWLTVADVTPRGANKPVTFIDQLVTFAELVVATLNESLAQDMKFWVAAIAA